MSVGFVMVPRSEIEIGFGSEKRTFSNFEAWVDILATVSWSDKNSCMINGELIEWGRGEMVAGRSFLAKRWGWGEQRVRTFLTYLQNNQTINLKITRRITILTLLNKTSYKSEQPDEQPADNQTSNQPITTIKEYNNKDKEDKTNTEDNLVELDKIVKVWNSFADATGVPAINGLSKSRVAKLRARNINIELLVKILERAMRSDFLTGKSGRWKMTFDWLFANDTNYNKVMEGNYDNQESVSGRRVFEFEREAKGKYDHLA